MSSDLRAVWSFWTKPFLAHRTSIWTTPAHHLYSWVLSFETARRHYPDTTLVTDDPGASILIDTLGLPFKHVSLALNEIDHIDPGWWAAGKLTAYQQQDAPFIHIDSDAYLWKPLPDRIANAPVFAQCPERFAIGRSYYEPVALENALHRVEGTWLPPEWQAFRKARIPQYALCCGILGGCDTGFLKHYAAQALRLIEHPENRDALQTFDDKIGQTILIEQYLLAACVEYHGVNLQCLFPTQADAHTTDRGYTHLIAGAKRDAQIAARLERRIESDYPHYHNRCIIRSDDSGPAEPIDSGA